MKTRHIETIREQFGVALTTIFHYNNDHRDAIEHIKDIFYLKGNSKEKVLALLYMLSLGEEDDAIQKYRGQTGLNNTEYNSKSLLDQYKVLLLTALVYSPTFYAMAKNFRGFVSAGLAVGEEVKEDSLDPAPTSTGKITHIPIRHRLFPISSSSRKVIGIAAAAGFALILFVTILLKIFNIGPGPQISNAWASIIIEPENDGIAYIPMEDMGVRIDLLSPLTGRPRGATNEIDNTKTTISYYTKAIRTDKNNTDLYINRGIAYTLDGYIEAAIKDFNKAIELDPKNASAYYNRAIANAGKNAETEVIAADFKTAIAINPDDKDAYYALGVLYYRQYEKNKTMVLLETAIDAFGHIKGYKDADNILDYLKELRNR
jgi:tetratricopeptide (TPR) repeat protein